MDGKKKAWFQARSRTRDLRRAAERELGPLTGRQWEKVRRAFRNFHQEEHAT